MEIQVKILLVEPAKYQSLLIEREIHQRIRGAVVSNASTAGDIMRILRSGDVDIAIVDLDSNAEEGMNMLRSLSRADGRVKIIAVAADLTDESATKVLSSGADELLFKDESFHTVIPRIVEKICRAGLREQSQAELTSRKQKSNLVPESISTAAGVLAHEVNNPLMTILGTAELILEQAAGADPELTRKMLTIKRSARRIRTVLKKLSSSMNESAASPQIDSRFRSDDREPVTK